VRLNRVARTAYVPAMRVRHHGGGAARKGLRHIAWFVASGLRFYASTAGDGRDAAMSPKGRPEGESGPERAARRVVQ